MKPELFTGSVLSKPVFFGFGKQIIKVCAENPDYLKDITNLLAPFNLTKHGKEIASFNVVFPDDNHEAHNSFYVIFQDGKEIFKTTDPFRVMFRLEWLIIRLLLENSNFLQIHSAVVEKDGKAILFPAESNSGKTTMAVALSQDRFQCFSDEVALVDADSHFIHPFPRNIHIEPEQKELFSSSGYRVKFKKLRWGNSVGENFECRMEKTNRRREKISSKARFIIFPKYSPAHNNKLHPISRANAFMGLLKNEINFNRFQGKGLDIIEGLVKDADCYEMETGDLEGAVAAIKNLFPTPP